MRDGQEYGHIEDYTEKMKLKFYYGSWAVIDMYGFGENKLN